MDGLYAQGHVRATMPEAAPSLMVVHGQAHLGASSDQSDALDVHPAQNTLDSAVDLVEKRVLIHTPRLAAPIPEIG
ncbi:MAG: hypothetical protein EPO09_08815 [Aquabacterium sp.]|uniref:hypothetical protein n=1 Tax=Aquabacterium sp. TaxID=1872578 RepID=UPI001217344E|nr:hypothetical protein [Aquabacterium sp.]TAK94836.1 MAG: hypothetical protein EPO09_08815 [Aquabacterium sp.]